MRIAALITAYHRPDLLGHLIDRLNGNLWQVYVHLDKRSDTASFSHLAAKVRSLQSVYRVHWASFGNIQATLYLMRQAVEDPGNTHFYVMSGQCYPIKRDEHIAALLESEPGNFITILKMPVSHKPLDRLTRWHFHDARAVGVDSSLLKKAAKIIFNQLPQREITKTLRGMQPYAGSAWWLLNRATVCAVLEFIDDNRWFLNAFRWSFVPDEMFFQTIVGNLGVRPDRMTPTFTKWIEGEMHPLLIGDSILKEAKRSWHLSARKFDRIFE